ncbi:MAG: helix-turn-helix transcriptional regulator [Anaerotignum sp.]|nr:helix-turn-helix transcriptional regulator [Anaerotignum sp.]
MKKLTNLRLILEYFEVPNRDLAKAINVSPSMVSNWVQGKRALRASSGFVVAIADYVLSRRMLETRDITWLKKQFEHTGISTEFDFASDIKRNLIIWLADDGHEVLEIFKKADIQITNEQRDDVGLSPYLYSIGPAGRIYNDDYSARAGVLDISMRLGRIFETMKDATTIDICLSSETVATIMENVFIAEIMKAFQTKNIYLRMLAALSGNSTALSRIIAAYTPMIVAGKMELYISHGMMQPMIHQTSIFIPDICAVAITELPDSLSPPAALFITESIFLKDSADGFDRVVRFAQPLMQFYPDNILKGMIDIFNREFSDDGDMDIQSDGLNFLMLEPEEYIEILEQKGFKGNALEWRSEEYLQIKNGFESNLKNGAVFREIISAEFLKNMVVNGSCEVPSMYFMDTGNTLIQTKACAAILAGYIRMLKSYPNYHISVAPYLGEKQKGTRHIKHGRHVTLGPWKNEPKLIFSDQMIMIHEFQTYFNELWMSLSAGTRENTILLLEIMLQEIEKLIGQEG